MYTHKYTTQIPPPHTHTTNGLAVYTPVHGGVSKGKRVEGFLTNNFYLFSKEAYKIKYKIFWSTVLQKNAL